MMTASAGSEARAWSALLRPTVLHHDHGRSTLRQQRADAAFQQWSGVVIHHDGGNQVPTLRAQNSLVNRNRMSALERAEAVTPGDLLALVDFTPGIGDRHFVNAVATAQHLGRDFGFEVEAIGDNGHALDHLGVEQLVARLHVRQGRAVQHVGDQRQEAIAGPMQRQHVLALAGESAAVDHPGLALEYRLEQAGPVVRVVLEIGILDEEEIAGGQRQPGTDGRTLALVLLVGDDPDGRILQRPQDLLRTVAGAVVDHNHLQVDAPGQLDGPHAANDLGHGRPLVEYGHDHARVWNVGSWCSVSVSGIVMPLPLARP